MTTLRTLVQWRARHDTSHAQDVANWRVAQPSADGPAAILLAALRGWRRTLSALSALPQSAGEQVGADEQALHELIAWAEMAQRGLHMSDRPTWDYLRPEPAAAVTWRRAGDALRALADDMAALLPADLTQPMASQAGQTASPYSRLLQGQPPAAAAITKLCQSRLAG
jgi:hypothetical protein